MTGKNVRALAATLVLCSGLSIWLSGSAAQEPQQPKPASKLVEPARAAFQAFETMFGAGRATPEDLYRWSRRLMEAELKADPTSKAAAQDHKDRMKTLLARIEAQYRGGVAGADQATLFAAIYYVAEAESQ